MNKTKGLTLRRVKIEEGGRPIFPDVRGTIIQIGYGVDLDETYVNHLMRDVAPKTFAGGLRIVA